MTTPGNGRNKWSHKEAAAEFHARHNHAPYSMAFNARLEAEARNPALDPLHRFMSGRRAGFNLWVGLVVTTKSRPTGSSGMTPFKTRTGSTASAKCRVAAFPHT